MAKPVSFVAWNYFDSTIKEDGVPESSGFEVPVTTLTAANLAAQTTLIDNLTAAIEALVLGNLNKVTTVLERDVISQVAANDQRAQRGIKLLCRYHDALVPADKFRVSIPTFDLLLLPLHNEFLDIDTASTPGNNFKVAFEAIVKSPNDGTHAVILDSAQYVD